MDVGECKHQPAPLFDGDLFRMECVRCGLSGAPAATKERAATFYHSTAERVRIEYLIGLRRPLGDSEAAEVAYSSWGTGAGCRCGG